MPLVKQYQNLTVTEKVLLQSIVEGDLIRGSRIGIKAHQTLGHDLNAIMTFLALESMGIEKVDTEVSVQYIDHNMIQADYKNADDHRYLREITSKLGVICARPGSGICHQLHLEHFGRPGKTLIGGDSHTVAAGGIGMFSIGVGGFDAAMAMAGAPLYITMPQIVKVNLVGKLPRLVSAKNIILEVLRRLTVKGGIGKVLEYCGPGVGTLNVAERSIIANMGAETGATTSIFPSDEQTKRWLAAYNREEQWVPIAADSAAVYDDELTIDLSQLEPLIALPSQPDKVVPVREVAGKKIDQVMLGSCTNTALNDVLSIANVLKDRFVSPDVDVSLYPSTRTVIRESIRRGAYDQILAAGVRMFEPICGGCNGCGFAPGTEGVSLRTTPRNFEGRSGTKSAHVYLCAPETAVASALTGVITDPRELDIPDFFYDLPEKFVDAGNLFNYPEFDSESELTYGPNIKPIPKMEPLEDLLSKPVMLKLPDNITTDHICPAGALYLPIRSNIPEISRHSFNVVDESFSERAKASDGSILVAGTNYGQGSSREQAAIVPRYLGVKAVMAMGFARLHLANMVNWGLLPLVFRSEQDYAAIEQGDVLEIDTSKLKENEPVRVLNRTSGSSFYVDTPLVQADLDAIKVGGRVNTVK